MKAIHSAKYCAQVNTEINFCIPLKNEKRYFRKNLVKNMHFNNHVYF